MLKYLIKLKVRYGLQLDKLGGCELEGAGQELPVAAAAPAGGADAADSAARGGGACGRRGPRAGWRRGSARRRDAARLSVETRGPPALAARSDARPPRARVSSRSRTPERAHLESRGFELT